MQFRPWMLLLCLSGAFAQTTQNVTINGFPNQIVTGNIGFSFGLTALPDHLTIGPGGCATATGTTFYKTNAQVIVSSGNESGTVSIGCDVNGLLTAYLGSGLTSTNYACVGITCATGSSPSTSVVTGSDTISQGKFSLTPVSLPIIGGASAGSGTFVTLSGDAISTATGGATTIIGVNGILLSGLATCLLTNTTGTGKPGCATIGSGLSFTGGTLSNTGAPATSGTSILYGNGSGGFSNVIIGSNLTFSGGTLSATGGGSGVTSVATTSPLTGGPITSTGTIACATCVVASSPGLGLAHFGGGTQTVTSSAVSLTADVTGLLPHANIASTAVTPGSYTNTNLTVAADGSITAASNGTGGSGGFNGVRFASGTTDTILSTDSGKTVVYTNAGAVAVTLPPAGSTGFTGNFSFTIFNRAGGNVTVTPTTSTIDNVSALTIYPLTSDSIGSDATNWNSGGTTVGAGTGMLFGNRQFSVDSTYVQTKGNLLTGGFPNNITPSSGACAYTFSTTPTFASYSAYGFFPFTPDFTCSSSPTLNLNTLGALPILTAAGASNPTLTAGTPVTLKLDATGANFRCQECGLGGFSPSGTQAANAPLVATSGSAYGWNAILYPTSGVSGGILYGSSATQIAFAPLITAGFLVKSGGAGTAPAASLLDDGITTANTLTYAGTSGIAAKAFTGTGTAAGIFGLPANATPATIPANAYGLTANAAMTTSYFEYSPNAVPTANQVKLYGAPSSNIGTWTWTGISGSGSFCMTTSCAMTTPALGTPSALVLTNATGLTLAGTPLTTPGDLLFANSTPVLARLGIGSTGQCLQVTSGLPAWGSCVSASFSFPITVSGTVNSGGIPYFNSATQMSSTAALAAHGVVIGEGAGSAPVTTGTGTSGQCLTSNGASADPTFQTCGTGTGVSSFSGDGALLSNSGSTGGVTAALANAGAHKFFGNNTGSSTTPGYETLGASDVPARQFGGVFTTGTSTPVTTGGVVYWVIPYACTIKGYSIQAIPADTATVKFWRVATGTTVPTSSNSISTSGVSLATGSAIDSTTVTDFTSTAVSANDHLAITLSAVGGVATYVYGAFTCQ